jgi:hypothetical protein
MEPFYSLLLLPQRTISYAGLIAGQVAFRAQKHGAGYCVLSSRVQYLAHP